MSSAGGRQPSQSRAIPTRTVALSDPAQLPPDYCTTPGGTLFSTTPGGKGAGTHKRTHTGACGAAPGEPLLPPARRSEHRPSRPYRAYRALIAYLERLRASALSGG